jgi:hypothetical protein
MPAIFTILKTTVFRSKIRENLLGVDHLQGLNCQCMTILDLRLAVCAINDLVIFERVWHQEYGGTQQKLDE